MHSMKRFSDKSFWTHFLRFSLVGGAALACSLGGFYFLVDMRGIPYLYATGILFFVINFFSFLLNKYFTFRTESEHFPGEIQRYYLLMAWSFFLNLLCMFVLVDILGIWYIGASLVTAFLMMWHNFFWSYSWGFRRDI
jgi:putative flippase GtrA